jgi:hypothetical protein
VDLEGPTRVWAQLERLERATLSVAEGAGVCVGGAVGGLQHGGRAAQWAARAGAGLGLGLGLGLDHELDSLFTLEMGRGAQEIWHEAAAGTTSHGPTRVTRNHTQPHRPRVGVATPYAACASSRTCSHGRSARVSESRGRTREPRTQPHAAATAPGIIARQCTHLPVSHPHRHPT